MKAAQRNELRPLAHDEVQPGAVGRVLRDAREGFGQDIATVSQQLRIRSIYLNAIESGRYQDLPGSTYAVGFVRSYAEYLGLEPNEIVRRFRDEAAEVNGRTKLKFPMPAVEARVPSGALVLMALMVAVLAYGGWYYLSDRDRSLVDLVPSVPESLQALIESDSDADDDTAESAPAVSLATADAASVVPTEDTETDASVTTVPSSNAASTAPDLGGATYGAGTTALTQPTTIAGLDINVPALDTAPTLETGAPAVATISDLGVPAEAPAATTGTSGAVAAEIESAATSAATALDAAATDAPAAVDAGAATGDPTAQQLAVIPAAPSAPSSVQENQDFGVAFGGSRVVIVARMESFLRVRDADGNEIWSRLLRSGDRYLVPERDGLTLTVGNAGGVDVFVDGRKAPALGAIGVGMSGISLDPTRLASGTALP